MPIPRQEFPTGALPQVLKVLARRLDGELEDLKENPEWFGMALTSATTALDQDHLPKCHLDRSWYGEFPT
ncbi:hypothetical protein [Streptomyces sp. NPDC057623]|uniref:hypothetical protein n=1 Tax=Streptomyces sp. NPDC057623 TaxID=3346187 RepID=UPI00367E570D